MRYRLVGRDVYMAPQTGAGRVRVVVEEAGAVHPLATVCDLTGTGSARLVIDPGRVSWGTGVLRQLVLARGVQLWRRHTDRVDATRETKICETMVYELWADLAARRVAVIRRPHPPRSGIVVEDYVGYADRLGDATAELHLGAATGALPIELLLSLQAWVRVCWQRAVPVQTGTTVDRVPV
ncbi:hypothetical protein [Glycomyces sp. NPDC047010]|uniref:hypothetical protein n=1 Tax=Glycomyces sp. NPDC047010 TaxID=3155023 RepID=UPI0034045586